ncbi:hypothetical protein ADU72_1171 [Pediococcus damnosus]|uniref:Uncharacterized protein n=1 Tax=Pediococcus damnosus TaxID=51663 RepID=A0A0R2HLE6_9LACO|nr:glycosyltransferase [Pediococcus damnosus]AMV60524.1 hypothetical protein ADU69_0861 [Pediococcus damnosus]AMV63009.1 hypothetical protein ADU70_1525 [Pediococcus damnosus]AMV64839.1 hypothetical protein ADU71_0937 [Pediococcus damnosus]AMV67104.1 hypothetical protein ADU72_1171 [Pediococcus damnosus]AMV69294.1 hypothetical protein ADU73_0888 [Pediococcus damnosus]
MNVLYCGDANMADGLIISVLSLLKNSDQPLSIYVLTAQIHDKKHKFQALPDVVVDTLNQEVQTKNPANKVIKIDITKQFQNHLPTANLNTMYTPYCMLRLFADLVPEIPDRVLYLDTDVVARRNFDNFYNQPLTETDFVGVLDYYGRWFFHHELKTFDYINSGVLLMNLKEIRHDGFLARCRKLCTNRKMIMPDQSALNKLTHKKKIESNRFNEQHRLQQDTVFQHFTTSFRLFPLIHTLTVKPWQINLVHRELKLHEYDDLFDQYKNILQRLKDAA